MSPELALVSWISSDMEDFKVFAMKLVENDSHLGGIGFGTHFLRWLASLSAIYLLILDRTNWRSKMLTSLLVPYIFISLPSASFFFLRGEVGKWIAFIGVVLRLFFHRRFPDALEMPGCLILLMVVAPDLFAQKVKESWMGVGILIMVACYLLQEHVRATGGLRNSFVQSHGISNTLGLILLLAYPLWAILIYLT